MACSSQSEGSARQRPAANQKAERPFKLRARAAAGERRGRGLGGSLGGAAAEAEAPALREAQGPRAQSPVAAEGSARKEGGARAAAPRGPGGRTPGPPAHSLTAEARPAAAPRGPFAVPPPR